MKRIYLVLTTLFLFTGMAWADDTKGLALSNVAVIWGDSTTWDANTGTMTYSNSDWGNGAIGWSYGSYMTDNDIETTSTNLSAYNALVVKLDSASDQTIEVVVCENDFWDDDRYLSTSITAGTTCDTISLTARTGDYTQLDLSSINLIFIRTNWTTSQTIKLDSVYLTNLSDAQYSLLSPDVVVEQDFNDAKVEWNDLSLTWDKYTGTIDFYATAYYYSGTDVKNASYYSTSENNTPCTTTIMVDDTIATTASLYFIEYKNDTIYVTTTDTVDTNKSVVDTAGVTHINVDTLMQLYYATDTLNNTVYTTSATNTETSDTYHTGAANGAVSWAISIEKTDSTYTSDLSGYDSLVVKLAEASSYDVEVTVSQNGFWDTGVYCQNTISKGNTELHINLNECSTGDGSMLNRDSINMVFIRTAWVAEQTIKIDEIYVVNVGDTIKGSNNQDTIINANTKYIYTFTAYDGSISQSKTSGAYGTICLPYDATTTEATIYDVVGYGATTSDGTETPSCLYLEAVSSMEAGKAYVYKSTTDSIVNFTLTGVADEPADAATGNALVGNISTDSVAVGEDDYILTTSNSSYVWGKGTGNYVRRYKAYLDLDVLKGEESSEETTAEAKGWIRMSIEGDGSDDTTGIKEIETEEKSVIDDDAIYNLSGVRVTNPQKGIYIKNGKKYIIK